MNLGVIWEKLDYDDRVIIGDCVYEYSFFESSNAFYNNNNHGLLMFIGLQHAYTSLFIRYLYLMNIEPHKMDKLDEHIHKRIKRILSLIKRKERKIQP